MTNELESIWDGRAALGESLERDYAAYTGEGWDLIWQPTSPLTTPWWDYAQYALPDPEQHVETSLTRRKCPRRLAAVRILRDWSREYDGRIAQQGGRR